MTRLHRRRRERATYNERHVQALADGFELGRVFGPGNKDTDPDYDARRRQAWEDLRDEILAQWIADKPLSRPSAWWRYDAPELRRCLNRQHPFEHPEFIAECESKERQYPGYTSRFRKTWWGEPCMLGGPPGPTGKDEYETERDYLIRLDLLTDYERTLLAPADAAAVSD